MSRLPGGLVQFARRRPPWWLRLRAVWCKCPCHAPKFTPADHARACCPYYSGTVARGWGSQVWDY